MGATKMKKTREEKIKEIKADIERTGNEDLKRWLTGFLSGLEWEEE